MIRTPKDSTFALPAIIAAIVGAIIWYANEYPARCTVHCAGHGEPLLIFIVGGLAAACIGYFVVRALDD
jgi:H+/Cl- antiporter ClcA